MVEGANYERNKRDVSKVLVVGIPRGGTTWIATALGWTESSLFVDEPDDERRFEIARDAKCNLGRYPIIAPGDERTVGGYDITLYEQLWEKAWNVGNEFNPQNVILKSALAPYCLEWLLDRHPVDAVVWCDRFPLNTLASWLEYGKKTRPQEDVGHMIKRMVWQYGMLYQTYTRLERTGHITVRVRHEELAGDFTLFEHLASACGLKWTYRAAEWLNDMNQEGEGGHWGTEDYKREEHVQREAKLQRVHRWRERISQKEADWIVKELAPWEDARLALTEGRGGL